MWKSYYLFIEIDFYQATTKLLQYIKEESSTNPEVHELAEDRLLYNWQDEKADKYGR